jgi:hypothetical protein
MKLRNSVNWNINLRRHGGIPRRRGDKLKGAIEIFSFVVGSWLGLG